VLDAPVVFDDDANEDSWRPENSSGEFHGPTRLREALVKSRNLVSVRLMRAMGVETTIDYLTSHFGFAPEVLPRDLTLALGTLQLAPVEVAASYAAFANGGFRVQPYLVERIETADGTVVHAFSPAVVCAQCTLEEGKLPPENPLATLDFASPNFVQAADALRGGLLSTDTKHIAPRAINAQNAWLLTDMMKDVITRGTARRARDLGRNDLAGKTGTTNDQHDAWFSGFNANLVATAWVGFDQAATLGAGEEGGRTALPVWVHFMREALRGMPEARVRLPEGLVTVRISPATGKLAGADDIDAIFETFMEGRLPEAQDPFERGDREKARKDDPLF
jgi:penicillin-binding protein 1A